MEQDVSTRDLRNHTARVLDDIADGSTVYITRNGQRVAMLTPLTRARHPANDKLLAFLDATEAVDTGWLEEYLDGKAADAAADSEREQRLRPT